MKANKLILSATILVALGLSACTTPAETPSTSEETSTSQTSEVPSTPSSTSSTYSVEWDGKTNADFEKAATTYQDGTKTKDLNMNTIYRNSNSPHLDPLEEQRVLVIPFGFTDDKYQSVQTQENLKRIETTFFGDPGDVDAEGWYSVETFYETSSYGLSDFEGTVVPNWCVYNGTSTQFINSTSGAGVTAAAYARTWYINEYAKENHGLLGADAQPLTYFDQDGDGFIDLIWLVYSHEIVSNTDWWAYVTYTSNTANNSAPSVKTLGWASIGFMDKGFAGHDAHTFIHETGHTYGLDDYYDYSGVWAPMGGVDFMDHNLGDHSMFSKFTLGWTAPLVVDDTALITLRPGTSTGDCFIIPSPNYNGTAFDEYIMVELMAPHGVAKHDYINGYEGTTGYSVPGLRITHVDARVKKGDFDTTSTANPEEGRDFRVCNTNGGRSGVGTDSDYWPHKVGGKTEKEYYTLTSLFESDYDATNCWKSVSTYNATNKALFRRNHSFDLNPEVEGGWAETFMPSRSNLWNKAKVNTSRTGSNISEISVDETCTFNYTIQVLNIVEDAESGYVAYVKVLANQY